MQLVNKVKFSGYLCKLVDVHLFGSSHKQAAFCVRNIEKVIDEISGEEERYETSIRCVAFDNLASHVECMGLELGGIIGVTGHLRTRSWEKANKKKGYVTELVCDAVAYLEPPLPKPGEQQQLNLQ